MGRRVLVTVTAIWAAAMLSVPQAEEAQAARQAAPPRTAVQTAAITPAAPAAQSPASYRAVVDQYCVTCHNQRLKTGGLTLDTLDMARVPADAAVWEKVIRKVRGNMMPPAGMPRPDAATVGAFMTSLESELDRAALARPNPGRALLHRFNRAEYANAIRDLLTLEIDPELLLPPDDSSYGFDNIADVLGMSPLLMERYVNAAERISALAVGDMSTPVNADMYRLRMDHTQTNHIAGLPLGTRGGAKIRHNFPVDGEYVIKAKLWKTSVGFVKGLQTEHELEIGIDGERVLLAPVGGRSDYQMNVLTSGAGVEAVLDDRLRTRVKVAAGPHDVAVTFIAIAGGNRMGPEGLRPTLFTQDPLYIHGMPSIESFTIEGPYNPTAPGDTPSRRAVFTCRPSAAVTDDACARTILSRLARRAYRRPVSDADLQVLMTLYADGRRAGGFERGIQLALQGVLTSPHFLFRVHRDPANLAAGAVHRLTDLELASRLSFFLWSSIPDEALLDAAAKGQLGQPASLEREVRRMLTDPRAEALVRNFGGQWLHLRNLEAFVPDRVEFPEFDGILKDAMRRETELLLDSVLRGDRNVLDLLRADYTFVNEPLARHYGIRGIYGSDFQRVTIQDPNRRGLLGHASILAVTSFPSRTSPVVRGQFVLTNILGTPPPPPPPDVPLLLNPPKPKTMRERMEVHRANPVCSSCHRVMDPIGNSLENFDATGAWRTRDGENAIDPTDTLADGTKVDGPVALRQALLRDPGIFVGTLTEKLMTYALGRGVEPADMPAIRKVTRDAATSDYRASAIITGIVKSVPFQMRIKPMPNDEQANRGTAAPRPAGGQ